MADDLPRMEKRLDDVRRDVAARQDTSGDNFLMILDGQEIRNRGVAGELLLRRAERARGHRSEQLLGTIAGFQVFVADNFMQGPEIVLKGTGIYIAKLTDTALGTIRSVEHVIQHFEESAATLAQNIADTRKRLIDTEMQVNAPFEYGERLAGLVKRQREIEETLDLTKNQAPVQLTDEAANEAGLQSDGGESPNPQGDGTAD